MKKRLAFLLAAFTLVVATAWALGLNGGVISVTNSPGGTGVTGLLQCVYNDANDATHATTWQIRRLVPNNPPPWGSPRKVSPAANPVAVSVDTGATYRDYEIQFTATPPDTFTGQNPYSIRVYCNQLYTFKVHYQ